MGFVDRIRTATWAATEAAKKQAKRVQFEIRASQLESSIRRQKTEIGKALYPLLKSGELESELAEVQVALIQIAALNQQLEANAAALDALAKPSEQNNSIEEEPAGQSSDPDPP